MKKLFIIYGIYITVNFIYFYFLYPLDSFSDTRYGALSHAFFFTMWPLQLLILFVLIKKTAVIHRLEEKRYKIFLFTSLLVGLDYFSHFPFRVAWYVISKNEGTRTQGFLAWLLESLLSTGLFWISLFVILTGTRFVINRWPLIWGWILWLLLIPIILFVMFVQPIWIDPLFDDFSPIQNGKLKESIIELTTEAGIADSDIFVVNKSEKVSTYNAYVTGIFNHARIVLWDTTIEGMQTSEILFIMAHEIAHYIYQHVYWGNRSVSCIKSIYFIGASKTFTKLEKCLPTTIINKIITNNSHHLNGNTACSAVGITANGNTSRSLCNKTNR
ncbi:peptidase [Gracilibacillus boraciitolerans JCM 21714]|uniref:Peptidase n=1 Tax=Gracilibacillus boraciitolerans JCM 21714 TaxID=1298598 RepID=W4VKB0_9BACI|nr:peptidase [Gracilibacillus boraciitolerans JCM 21714]